MWGPVRASTYISTEQIYAPARTVGIDRQTDFLQVGVFAQYDYRDIPGGPRSGGNYIARFTYNKDVDSATALSPPART